MAGKDVELRIKAHDDKASANVKRVSDALKALKGDAEDAASGSKKFSGALGGLAGDVSKLQGEMNRLKAVGQIAAEFDKSSAAVDRLKSSLKSSEAELAQIARQHSEATAASKKLQTQLAGEVLAREENKSALAASRKELVAINALVREATEAEKALNAVRSKRAGGNIASIGVGHDSGAPNTSARASMGAFIQADLAANRAAQARATAEVKNYENAVTALSGIIKESSSDLRVAEASQNKLTASVDKATTVVQRNQAALANEQAELSRIGGAVTTASGAMSGMVVTQENVAKSAERMAAQLANAKARIEALSNTSASVAPGQDLTGSTKENTARREAVERLRELRREILTAQADAQRLNAAFRSTAQPTEQMGAEAGRAQARVRALKDELNALTGRLRASSGSFKEFDQAARGVQTTANTVAGANGKIATTAERAGSAQRQIAPAVRQTGVAMGDAAQRTNNFNGALLGLGSGTRQANSALGQLRSMIVQVTAGYLSFHAAVSQMGGAIDAYRTLEATQSRLGAVFEQDTRAVAVEIDFLRAQSDRLGISFGVLAEEYGKFSVAAGAANFTLDETRQVFLSVAEAGRVNKLSMDQMSGVFLALQQMISKGKVSAEELRGQLGERLTGAYNIFADAIGVTTAELDEMMRKGEVISDRSTMLKFADELSERFGPQLSASIDTVTTDLGRFENSVFTAQLALAQGFIPGLREALQSFNEFANSSEGRLFFTEVGVSIGKFISLLAEVPKHFDLIKAAVQAFVAVKLAGFLVNTVQQITRLRGAFTGLQQSMSFIGPQMQQMTMTQQVLGQGFAQVVGRIDAYRATLMRSTASTSTANIGLRAYAASLGVLRGALMVTAGAARALWAAFGGLPGIIATGIAFAVGGWMTNVDDATSALVEHERQIGEVKNAYHAAGDNLEGWADTIKNLTLTEAETNLTNLTQEYSRRISQLQDRAIGIRTVFDELNGPFGQQQRAGLGDEMSDGIIKVIGLLDQLEARTISVDEFRTSLDGIGQTTASEELKAIVADLLEFTRQADENQGSLVQLGSAIDKQTKLVKGLKGETEELTEIVDDNTDAVGQANDEFDRSAAVDKYTAAIETLASKIPELANQMKYLKDMTEMGRVAWDGLVAAYQAGDFGAMLKIGGLWAQQAMATQSGYASGAVTGSLVDRIVGVESGGNAGAKNPNSSATGLGQFIESTWLNMFKKYFPDIAAGMTNAAILEKRTDPTISRQMVDLYAQENSRFLAQYGIMLNDANLYLAHFLGPNGAKNVLTANPSTPVDQLLEPSQIEANQSILQGKNAGQVVAWAQQKMGLTEQELAVQERMAELRQEELDQTAEQQQATSDRIAEGQMAVSQQELINAGKARQAAVEAAIAAARAENPAITEAEIEQITVLTEKEWDLKNAVDEKAASEERVNQLYMLRQQLLEQLQMANEMGDLEQATNLQIRIADVNGQLETAIQKAIAMWRAIGGPEADAAIAKLQTTSMSLQKVGTNMGSLGLSMNQWGNLAGSFADGLLGVFDSFAQAIANGQDAVASLGRAFLQFAADFLREIAQMILKQMMLNMLQGLFPGLGGMMGHTGGMVGKSAIGGGNQLGGGAPWMQNALKYHTGGVAGLKPDEVNATLRVGEEVLTEEDPRHRNNLMDEKDGRGSQSNGGLKQVLVLDPNEIAGAMSTKAGESAVMTIIKSNRSTIRQMLG